MFRYSLLLLAAHGLSAADPAPPIPKAKTVVVDAPAVKAPAVPPSVPAKIGEVVRFKVSGKDVGYCITFNPTKCLCVRLYNDEADTMEFMAVAYEAGSYPIAFWFKGEIAGVACNIVAPDGTPPKPPTPPAPNPYRDLLKAAFDRDTGGATKNDEIRKDLAELYRQAGTLVLDKTFTTTKQLRDKLKSVSKTLAEDALAETRTAVAEIVGGVLQADAPLDQSTRDKATAMFAAIADALSW